MRWASVVREMFFYAFVFDLLFKQILFVEEYNEGLQFKKFVVQNLGKQRDAFFHTIDRTVFFQDLIVLSDTDNEQNSRDIVKTVNPFFSFGSLTAHIEHLKMNIAKPELNFDDSGCLNP